MISVHEAENIIAQTVTKYGTETVQLLQASGRVLAEDIYCDRDFPPYDRVSMDGIAIRYRDFLTGNRSFNIIGTQAAGDTPIEINGENGCVEIMTGAALPASADTIIWYEDLIIDNGKATLLINELKKGQNIHFKGQDKKEGDVAAAAQTIIDAAITSIAATVGKMQLLVNKLPKINILSTGDELVDISETPSAYQVRRSNGYTIKELLKKYGINAAITHLPDDPAIIEQQLLHDLDHFDVLLLSGGVSMGKYDYLPGIFSKLGIKQLFHKVQQRPGKPMWFGRHKAGTILFAFPGNPVSAFLCMHRYFIPWLRACLSLGPVQDVHAVLAEDVNFAPALQYFMQVKAQINDQGRLVAMPLPGNGSGDLANLVETNAFLELPADRDHFMKGELFRLWPFKNIL